MPLDPSDIPLPAFLDPLLDYLYDHLPPEVYSFITAFLSYSLALLTALVSLVSSLIASKPWEWDAQTIIPPLISFLAAYLALVSLYRTTSWIFRTTFWFVKWGTIFAMLAAGAGWYMGNQNVDGGGRGLVSSLGAVILGALNGVGREGAGARHRDPASRNLRQNAKPWEPFANQWQYQENNPTHDQETEARQIMSDIMSTANRILVEGGWWDAAKSVFAPSDSEAREGHSSSRRSGRPSSSSRR